MKPIAICGGDVREALRAARVANRYLEAEVDRLTEQFRRASRGGGYARYLSGDGDLEADACGHVTSGALNCNDCD